MVDLMKAMGYGEGLKTQDSRDGGIDGIINEDRLGFNLIYIQAKRWAPDRTIGRKEITSFVGSMAEPPRVEKGLFITTAKFTDDAIKYAKAQHIILVDGKLMFSISIYLG